MVGQLQSCTGVNFIKLWQNVSGEMRKVARRAIFFANFKENATYIANIFCMKK
jgi:hypothetical protein